MKQKKLFDDFLPVSTKDWEEKIEKDLKGADYDKKLIWRSPEGFRVKPYYRSEDLDKLKHLNTFPGEYPFLRGLKKASNDWLVRQDIVVDDYKKANQEALDILMKGVNSLGFKLNMQKCPVREDIETLMENIFADAVEINIKSSFPKETIRHYVDLVRKYNREPEMITGSVEHDPLGEFSLKGKFRDSAEKAFDQCREMIEEAQLIPHFRILKVDGTIFRNAGSSLIQELAFSIAAGVNYLTQLTDRNLSIDDVARRIKFCFAAGSNYFMEIAKLRAARMLWAQIVKAYGPSDESVTAMHIHTTHSLWNKTFYDPYVNMLRTTTEAMSAIIGGTESHTVVPFNMIYEAPTPFSKRIARNQQLILKEESYFDKVADPAAGSYYIENLTDSIMEEAWKLFIEVQGNGGYLEAFKEGFIQQKINETALEREKAIANRKEVLLGTNQYPDRDENKKDEFPESLFDKQDFSEAGATSETLKFYRGAHAFDRLRYQTDLFARENNRPEVFLFPIGNLAMRNARAQFAANFFAAAGYKIIENLGFKTVDAGMKKINQIKPEIVVICSSDEEYEEFAPAIAERISDHSIVVVAGYPKAILQKLEDAGIQQFIHIRSNVLETLQNFSSQLGIIK